MNRCRLSMTNNEWSYGSYRRKDYKKPMIYTFHQYKDFSLLYNLSAGKTEITDKTVEEMYRDGLISLSIKKKYEENMLNLFTPMDRNDEPYIEELYDRIQKERRRITGHGPIEQEQELKRRRKCHFDPKGGIDQTKKKKDLKKNCDSVIMILTQTELAFLLEEDIREWKSSGKMVYLLVSREAGYDIPNLNFWKKLCDEYDVQYLFMENETLNLGNIWGDVELENQINLQKTCLFFYGTDGFLQCRNLSISSVIHGVPKDYFTRSMTNQHGMEKAVVAYVPPNFDVTKWLSMTEKTRISYFQLARLWEDYGDTIYGEKPEQLYYKYPQYFLNIYASGSKCVEAKTDYPIQLSWPNAEKKNCHHKIMVEFDRLRDERIKQYINQFDNFKYYSTYFDENINEKEIPWEKQGQQNGILVQAVRVKRAKGSYVYFCNEGETVRSILEKNQCGSQMSIISNFLFFLTPKLAQLYNELRKDRPMEMLPFKKGHLDYMLQEKDGKRMESFPLFQKACIGFLENGQFLFFHFRLGGGKIRFYDDRVEETLEWNKEHVNPITQRSISKNHELCIYTPEFAKEDGEEDIKTYRLYVGEDRFNIVISQNRIICIRKGSVVLSSVGIVLSLSKKEGARLIHAFDLKELSDGYYDYSNLDFTVNLNPPKEISRDVWSQVRWAYGGGLSLIKEGKGICDDGRMPEWMKKEGWMSPLSRQTQESALHVLVKHPRTAIGMTKDGDLVVLVFSGRTKLSVGADYNEMCKIARKLFPDIWSMMNVDGGGSAMLGMEIGNSFMELSYPATSFESCAGMVRPINTLFYLKG